MFLDDKLYQICENYYLLNKHSSNDIQELNKKLFEECEIYYKSKITMSSKPSEVKIILDKTFNLFDSFVRRLKNSDNEILKIYGDLFEKFSFKKQFLNNPGMEEIYNKL